MWQICDIVGIEENYTLNTPFDLFQKFSKPLNNVFPAHTRLHRIVRIIEGDVMGNSRVPTELVDDLFHPRAPGERRTVYPEQILQLSDNGLRYNACFQRYTRQFVDDRPDQMVRWHGSAIENALNSIITVWNENDRGVVSRERNEKDQASTRANAATSLFSWSTDKSYLEQKRAKNYTSDHSPPKPEAREKSRFQTSESLSNKLGRIVEIESNRFIRARLKEISLHHSEQMSQQISERKRRDHERHLERLKLKEEQYNKELEQAMKEKKGGFFSLFNFSNQQLNVLPSKSDLFNETLFDVEEAESPSKPSSVAESPRKKIDDDAGDTSDEDFTEFTTSPPPLMPPLVLPLVSQLVPTTATLKVDHKHESNDVSLLDL